MVFSLFHSLLKHSLIFVSPIIIIFLTLAVTIPDVSLHKKVLKEQDFYATLSDEVSEYSEDIKNNSVARATNLEGVIEQSVLAYGISELSNEAFWQQIIESNLDNFQKWLNSGDYQGDNIAILWPDDQIQTSLTSNREKVEEFIQKNSTNDSQCSTKELEDNKNSIENLNCYITNLEQLSINDESQQLVGQFSDVTPSSFEWFGLIRAVKIVFNISRFIAVPLALVYLLCIIAIIIAAHIINHNARETSQMIFGRIGFSTLVATIGLITGLNIFSYFGLASGMFVSSSSDFLSFANIIQTQINAHLWAMLQPAIVVSLIFIAAGWVLRFLPKF